MGGSLVIKGGFFKDKKLEEGDKKKLQKWVVVVVASLTHQHGFHASLHISIGVCVRSGLVPCRIGWRVLPSAASPRNTNRSSAATAARCRWLAVISSFRRECHEMCRTWSVLQLPADYISRISILKGRLLEHTDNDWLLKIISPLIIDSRHRDLGEEMLMNTRKTFYCVNNNNYREIRSGCVGKEGDNSN